MKYAITIATLLSLTACGHGINSGTGKKIGQIIQLGQHGMFCSTYEGRLVRGGFNTGSGVSGGVFEFTVDSASLYEQLMQVMEKQQEIEVTYTKASLTGACTSESDHFVTSFRVITDTTPSVVLKKPEDEKERRKQELLKELKALGQ